jgi:hypothetical protein
LELEECFGDGAEFALVIERFYQQLGMLCGIVHHHRGDAEAPSLFILLDHSCRAIAGNTVAVFHGLREDAIEEVDVAPSARCDSECIGEGRGDGGPDNVGHLSR